ncbi:MAG: putative heme-binding domain-containing protein, partial [Porticoccaceae bacterium]
WSIYVSDGFDDALAEKTLNSPHEYVRAWTVRLLGDAKTVSKRLQPKLVMLARDEASVVVRSQLACTAKRLSADAAMPIVAALIGHDEDVNDAHMPLLLWWAIEDKAISDTSAVLRLFESSDVWQLPIAKEFLVSRLVSRLARRLAAEGTESGYAACAQFLALARTEGDVDLVLQGMVEASSGRRFESVPASLKTSLADILRSRPADSRAVQLALRMGGPLGPAFRLIEDPSAPAKVRVEIIRAAGEAGAAEAVDLLLQLVGRDEAQPILDAALSALAYFDNQRIARKVRSTYSALKPATRTRAIDLLCGRPAWALELLAAIEKKEIDAKAVTLDQVRQLLVHDDEGLRNRVTQTWGRVQPEPPLQKQGRISAVTQLLRRAKGDAARGLLIYEKTCAACHKLHGKGTVVGPDLTGAERKDRLKLIRNIVDPSSEIRPQYISHIAVTTSGRVLTGLLADSNAETITLLDAKNKRTVLNRSALEELRESTVSLMPEKLLDELTDQQIRDLLAYVQSDGPGK